VDYFVKHGEEKYGPYTLAELQTYVQEGRILAGDVAQSEGMTDWVPVSQILGNIPAPVFAAPVAPPVETVPLPPNLHWALLLVLLFLCWVAVKVQIFNWVWTFVLANWARKLSGNNKALVLVAMYPAAFLAAMLTGVVVAALGTNREMLFAFAGFCILGGLIAYIVGIFKIREAMEDYYNSRENIGLVLNGVMTFFFSSIYLQYHVNRIARWKKTGILD
jgi:hypothetical protein